MAQTHLNQVITAAGIDQADIDKIIALPAEDTTFKPDDYVGKIVTTTETRVKNDPKFWEGLDATNVNPAFKKQIESEQFGRAANITRAKVLKATGLTEADLGDMSEDDKKSIDSYVGRVIEKYAATKVSDKVLQADLLKTRKDLEELTADLPNRETKIKTDLQTGYDSEKMDFIILAELASIEGLTTPAKYLVKELAASLKAENSFEITGLTAAPKQKDNPKLDILDGSKVLTLKDLIVKKLTADNLIKKPEGETKQTGKTTVEVTPVGDGTLGISPDVLERINANKAASTPTK